MQRPPRTTETGPITRWVRRLTLAATALVVLLLAIVYPTLPETVPTHFGLTGEPDAWGPRASLIGLAAVLVLLIVGCAWLSKYPRIFNYPVAVTEANAQRCYRIGERMVVWLNVFVLAIFAGAVVASISEINIAYFTVPALVGMIGSLGVGLVGLIRVPSAEGAVGGRRSAPILETGDPRSKS